MLDPFIFQYCVTDIVLTLLHYCRNLNTQFTANELIHLWLLITLIKHLRDKFEQISVGSTAPRSQNLQTNEPQHLRK